MPGKILIIDDEEQLRKLLARIIGLEGFSVQQAASLRAATDALSRDAFDVVLCDVRLPDGNGVEYTRQIRERYPLSEVILLTAFGNIADGVLAIKNGAFDYIVKGDDNDRIIPLLYQAIERVALARKNAVQVTDGGVGEFSSIIGHGPLITAAVKLAGKIAPTDATVLLLGETGTGKEVFANAIHYNSKRKQHPMVAINCSAFTRDLLEGELFGHKAGAYTGALKDKKGLIETADKGTLFLDEIGEMNIELQAKLLRVLENGEFIKLGDTKTTRVDIRLIAATNRDLKKEITEGRFREDLYYRLNVFTIELPALRTRPDDLGELASYFLNLFTGRDNRPPVTISAPAMKLMENFPWKGNIRELRNVMERAVILVDGPVILPEHLPYDLQAGSALPGLSLAAVEQKHILAILQYTGGNKTRAAKLLEIGLATLYRKMEEYRIEQEIS